MLIRDLTADLRALHGELRGKSPPPPSRSDPSPSNAKAPQQVFGAALATVDSTVRDACAEAGRAIEAAVRAMNRSAYDFFPASKSKRQPALSSLRNPISPNTNLRLELADGRLVGACAAAKQLAAAIHRSAQAAGVSLAALSDNVIDDVAVAPAAAPSKAGEQALAMRHAAQAVARLSQMAGASRVAIALVRDEAERARVQRMRFAACGVLVNPIDEIVDAGAPALSDLLLRGSKAAAVTSPTTASDTNAPRSSPTTAAAAAAAMNTSATSTASATASSIGSSLSGFTSSALSGASSLLLGGGSHVSRLRDALSSTTATVTGVALGVSQHVATSVSKIANDTTDSIVSAMVQGGGGGSGDAARVAAAAASGSGGGDAAVKQQQERERLVQSLHSAASRSSDRRSLHAAVESIHKGGDGLRWRTLLHKPSVTAAGGDESNSSSSIADGPSRSEIARGLQLEHEGLTTKLRNESANAAKEMELSVRELGRMTTILQEQVSLQSEQLLVIERNTAESTRNLEQAQQELSKAQEPGFWSFKRILAAIVLAHAFTLLVLHLVLR
jgi:hypothetical protein